MKGIQEMERRAKGLPPNSEPKDGIGGKILVVLFFLLLAGGIAVWVFVISPKLDERELKHQRGKPIGSIIGAKVVVLLDAVDIEKRHKDSATDQDVYEQIERTRVTIVDGATGKQIEQKLVEGFGTCQPAGPDKMWCDFGELELYEMATFKRIANVEELVSKFGPILKVEEMRRKRPVYAVEGTVVTYLLENGRVGSYDAAAQKALADDVVPKSLQFGMAGRPRPGTLTTRSSCGASLGGVGIGKSGSERTKVVKGKLSSKDTFLQPEIIGSLDPPMFLHHSSLDPANDKPRLSRLDASGAVSWTKELGASCESSLMLGKVFVMTTTNPGHRAIAIDLDGGQVKWEVAF